MSAPMVASRGRVLGTCACGCGRYGELQNQRTGYTRACHQRWERAGFPESGPPAPTPGKRPETTGARRRRLAAAARVAWARGVARDLPVGAVEDLVPGWQQTAVCRNLPDDWAPDDWFPEDDETASDEVLAACDRCPVRRECLIEGLADGDPHSIRAGLTPYQRGRLPGRAELRLTPGRVAA